MLRVFNWTVGRLVQRKPVTGRNMKKVITVKEAAEMLGISESLVRRKDMKAKLSAFIVGSRGIRFYRAKVQAYIRQNTVRTPDRDDDTPKKSKRKLRNLTSRHDLW